MRVVLAFLFIFVILSVFLTPSMSNYNQAYALPATINKIKSGLIASDALTQTEINTSYWHFGGDAISMQAPYDYYENNQGLHIGVQAASSGQWAGFYGESPSSSAHLYHSVLKVPFDTVQDHWWDTGMYVQTSSPLINYVTCAGIVSSSGISWVVVSTKGDANQATEFNTLWQDKSPSQPYTRDCTIVTNGQNLLKVYLDKILVFSSTTLNLDMPEPFNTYLEVQTSTASQKLYGFYRDFYATSDTSIKVLNAPIGGLVKISDSASNKELGKDIVDNKGKASIGIARYHLPLSARIDVYDSTNNFVATKTVGNMWAGDSYKLSYNTLKAQSSTNDSDDATRISTGTWNENVRLHALPPSLFQ